MHSLTVENYIKSIYQICAAQSARPAATGQIAAALGVSPSTVTAMLKTLSEGGLATYAPYEGALLTKSGSALALRVLRRHRLIELFLSQTLHLAWDEVHEEAENMEHAVSDRLIDRIDEFLGHPKVDPHGDPIPRADGTVETTTLHTLATGRTGERFRLARVVDQSPDFLRFLADAGLPLGAEGKVIANQTAAGMLTVEVTGRQIHLGHDAAEKLLVAAIG
jgi:DtxR family Mn-dependent transcriptional regulator